MSLRRLAKTMETITEEFKTCPCKYCKSKNTRRYGHTAAKRQRWICNECHHTYIEADSPPSMRTPSEQIGAAISMFYEGLSLNAIRRQLRQMYDIYPSDSTVYKWITKYTKEAINRTKDLKPEVGNVWLCDETVLKVAGKKVWFYDIIDLKTRFLLASHLSSKRYLGDARIVLTRAAKKAGKKPTVVVTDSLPSYPQAIGDVFGCYTRHIKFKGITVEPNNNILERFHGTLKSRTKIMRGLKSMESAKLFTDGWLIFYNFMRPHESLHDKTPARYSGIQLKDNHWDDIVRSSPFKVEKVTWADDTPMIGDKVPASIKKQLGMDSKPPRWLR